jgi:hypothetical protein
MAPRRPPQRPSQGDATPRPGRSLLRLEVGRLAPAPIDSFQRPVAGTDEVGARVLYGAVQQEDETPLVLGIALASAARDVGLSYAHGHNCVIWPERVRCSAAARFSIRSRSGRGKRTDVGVSEDTVGHRSHGHGMSRPCRPFLANFEGQQDAYPPEFAERSSIALQAFDT